MQDLGFRYAVAFFTAATRDADTFMSIAEIAGKPAGYVLCTTNSSRLHRRAISSDPRAALSVALYGLRHPSFAWSAMRRLISRTRPAHTIGSSPQPPLRLLDIAVEPESRGKGLGVLLVEAAVTEAVTRGHDQIGLSVDSKNTPARSIYEKAGFEESGRTEQRDGRTGIFMRRSTVATDQEPAKS